MKLAKWFTDIDDSVEKDLCTNCPEHPKCDEEITFCDAYADEFKKRIDEYRANKGQ